MSAGRPKKKNAKSKADADQLQPGQQTLKEAMLKTNPDINPFKPRPKRKRMTAAEEEEEAYQMVAPWSAE